MGTTHADDARGADEFDERVLHLTPGVALAVSLDVAEIADMAILVLGRAVGLVEGVDCVGRSASLHGSAAVASARRTVGARGRAAVGVVAKGVDVHAATGAGVIACDVPADGGGLGLGRLDKGDGARNAGVAP